MTAAAIAELKAELANITADKESAWKRLKDHDAAHSDLQSAWYALNQLEEYAQKLVARVDPTSTTEAETATVVQN